MFTRYVYYLLLSVILINASGATAEDLPPPGGMRMLEGYRHEALRGIDSNPGRIWKPGGLEIHYDIGGLAGEYTDEYEQRQMKWMKRQQIDGREVVILLTNEDRMIITFRRSGERAWANFMATVKTPNDTTEVLLMVLTYRGRTPENQPTTRQAGAVAPCERPALEKD